jgi:glycosyltransferase involved in cell wall biosynthesis
MITLIATVLNEGDNIHHVMNSLQSQTRQPDEIVIVDGGSTDNTVTIMQSYTDQLPLRIFVEDGCNISQGRNRAIAEAQGDIIAVTDAGVKLTDTWLETITQPMLDNSDVDVVAGFFQADPQTLFEVAIGATTLPIKAEIDPQTFLPSSRSVAFRKASSDFIGGYPEWLDFCEDLIFDIRLQQTSKPFVFVPDALVYFRPRSSLRKFYKQYYLYARGDGKANLWRKRHIIRYITYGVVFPIVLLLGLFVHPLLWSLYLVGGAVYLKQPYRRLPHVMQTAPKQSVWAWLYCILMIPVIRIVGDIAKMIGYPIGWRWRKANRPPDWRVLPPSQ